MGPRRVGRPLRPRPRCRRHGLRAQRRPGRPRSVRRAREALVGYFDAVAARTGDFLRGLSAKDLDRVVDEGWDPPVTLGVRLVSVLNDDDQHVGQAAYVRGLVKAR